MTFKIIGSKGGSGSSFVTKPDTLRSNDSFEILLGLGSGRWKGLTNGLPSLKINGVPSQNEDGTSNFQDIVAVFADGNPLVAQLVHFKLGGGGATQAVNTQLANSNTGSPGPWVSAAIGTPNADFLDLRFVVQNLFYQDEKSIRENTATIEIELRPSNSATWTNIFTAASLSTTPYTSNGYELASDYGEYAVGKRAWLSRSLFNSNGIGFRGASTPGLSITGKTSSTYAKELRVAVPKNGPYENVGWEVRARLVEKDTIDNDTIQERRLISFESVTAVIKEPIGNDPAWAGQVWIHIHGKASEQFNGFPEVSGIFDTKICKTPPTSVWNPDTRQYTGAIWDGSYEEHFTTDPAWQIKEFVEDPIHGLAGLQPSSTLDKWDALEASKYYSELVPDGRGGTHPRFNLNLTLNEAQDVNELMQYLAGAVNSYTEDVGQGVWRLKVDKPETPKAIFTQDNIFGEFNYSHTDVDSRFNDWRGTFLNEELDYAQDTVRVYDQDDIEANGTRFTEVALVGCTNRQEALRRLMFRMRVALNEYKIVRFQTNRFGRYINPLDTVLVADGALNYDYLVKSTSRVDHHAGLNLYLKQPVRLETGVTYTINLMTLDKEVVTRTVTNSPTERGEVVKLTIDSALPNNIMEESAVSLEAVGLASNPIAYRVISVERGEENEDEYSLTCSIIDSGKWDAMDNVSEAEILAQDGGIGIDTPDEPAGGMFQLVSYETDLNVKRVLKVTWERPDSSFLEGFRVEYQFNDGSWTILSEKTNGTIAELENPEDGFYDFKITALDRRGFLSNPLIGEYEVVGGREYIDTLETIGKTSKLDVNGQVEDPLMYNTQATLGAKSTTDLAPTYTVGASDVTVNLPAHERKITGASGPITLNYGAASGVVPFSTYWVAYIDDPDYAGDPTPAVSFSSDPDDLLYPHRYHVASGISPASGGGGGEVGGGAGGGWQFDDCVATYAWVEVKELGNRSGVNLDGRYWVLAEDVAKGDFVRVLNGWALVSNNKVAPAPVVRLTAENGFILDVSASTPITQPDGSVILASEMEGQLIAADEDLKVVWQKCKVVDLGIIDVAHVSCYDGTYLAGNLPFKGLYSHNTTYKP